MVGTITIGKKLSVWLIVLSLLIPMSIAHASHTSLRSGLTISTHHINFNHKREGKDLKIQTGNQWSLQTNVSWVSFSKLNGSGTSTVQIKVITNNAVSKRSAKVIVNAGNISDTLIIEQEGQPVTLIASPSNLQIGRHSKKFAVQVVSNIPWQILKHDSWIHIDQIKSDLLGEITFTVEQTNGVARTGTLSISAGGKTFDILINQANIITAEEDNALQELDIYPNPATDFIKIEGSVNQYQLIDITGKVVLEDRDINSNYILIETISLLKGMYFMKLNTPLGTGTQKIIIR